MGVVIVLVVVLVAGVSLASYRWLRSDRQPLTFAERAERAERAKAERLARIEAKVRADGERRSAERREAADRGQAVKREAEAQVAVGKKRVKAPISAVGDRSNGALACPKCGGTSFKAKRSGKAKVASIGAAPLTVGASLLGLAKASQVKCVTCGTYYQRG